MAATPILVIDHYQRVDDQEDELSEETDFMTETITLTHAQLTTMVSGGPVTIAIVPENQYANIVSVVLEKDFTTEYTTGSTFFVVTKADDAVSLDGQCVNFDYGSSGIQLDVSGQKAVVQVPEFLKMYEGDIVIVNSDVTAMTGGHADNVLKITVVYTLIDKL